MSINVKEVPQEMAKLPDDHLFLVSAYWVGCFAGVMAKRGRLDIEAACCSFLQELHELTGGVTPLPPQLPPR